MSVTDSAQPDVVLVWRAFRLHALDCETQCERAYHLVLQGGQPDFQELHWLCCATGRPLLEAWHHACETRMDTLRENNGIRRLPA